MLSYGALKLLPFWDPLRGDPRFEKIVASLVQKNRGAQPRCSTERSHVRHNMKHWEIIADNLSRTGWSLDWISAVDSQGRTIWIGDAHRDDGKRFVVHADEKLTALVQLESAIHVANELA
jgi:hypothetical protein